MSRPQRQPAILETLDLALGMLGFFTLMIFLITAAQELRGQPALSWALALVVLIALLAAVVWGRRRVSVIIRTRQEVAARD